MTTTKTAVTRGLLMDLPFVSEVRLFFPSQVQLQRLSPLHAQLQLLIHLPVCLQRLLSHLLLCPIPNPAATSQSLTSLPAISESLTSLVATPVFFTSTDVTTQ
ncbi:hypothetical protein LSAT2_015716 [Lamellibrachia satsuma]|nr:hypothetical protein LSAT2_015716 [Lamellibrachia satsuma]